jgi:tRNA-splicing ligase RtcB (3'-phosphate/5'-hydroxy nucleic acid ligase)
MMATNPERLRLFLTSSPSAELTAAHQRLLGIDDIDQIAVMPDAHVAEGVAVGTVLATRAGLYPDAVGSDIGCGMLAVRLAANRRALCGGKSAESFLAGLTRRIPTHKWHTRLALPEFVLARASPRIQSILDRDGAVEFGSLGRGNHFVELDYDDEDHLYLVLHCGSRCVGSRIRELHRKRALEQGPLLGTPQVPGILAESDEGVAYQQDHDTALKYAGSGSCTELRAS